MSDLRSQLLTLLAKQSVCYGDFTLVSGRKSDFYVDSKQTTLDPRSALLVGKVGWNLIQNQTRTRGLTVAALGGLTMGADPIALAVGMAAASDHPEKPSPIQVFNVRKAAKAHGRTRLIEGNFSPGSTVVVVDDVITTGGSTLQAIDAIEAEGGKVAFALVLVDRQEGGREAIEARGVPVVSIFTRREIDAVAKPR
ncbi:MAG: orotate phosphoribosyltransferase [Verrucomicrobiales bacterium]|nr:orotate phosphoribosyltransferase [Verrucomicrobiales bacterium]